MKVADMTKFGVDESAAAFVEFYKLLGMEDVGSRAATSAFMDPGHQGDGPVRDDARAGVAGRREDVLRAVRSDAYWTRGLPSGRRAAA